jgi:hypothetical protein
MLHLPSSRISRHLSLSVVPKVRFKVKNWGSIGYMLLAAFLAGFGAIVGNFAYGQGPHYACVSVTCFNFQDGGTPCGVDNLCTASAPGAGFNGCLLTPGANCSNGSGTSPCSGTCSKSKIILSALIVARVTESSKPLDYPNHATPRDLDEPGSSHDSEPISVSSCHRMSGAESIRSLVRCPRTSPCGTGGDSYSSSGRNS